MLELKLGGRTISTPEDKQVLTINGNPIYIERIGNAIYVNKTAINLVIAEAASGKKTNWTKIGLAVGGVAVVGYAGMNLEAVLAMVMGAYEFVVPYVTDLIGSAGGLIDGCGSGTVSQ